MTRNAAAPSATGQETASARRGRLEECVRALSSLDRRTGTRGEHQSAELIASELSRLGARDVRLTPFRTQSSWAPANLAHAGAAVLGAMIDHPLGRFGTALVALSHELDVSGRSQWVRRLIPAATGHTVSARIPANGPARRTVVIVAHHDAAEMSMLWHPHAVALNRLYSRRTGRTMPTHLPLLAAMAACALPHRRVRRAAAIAIAAGTLLMLESARCGTTPGANDNAPGVAAAIELARGFAAEPPTQTEVILVFPGGEEVSNTGIRAWMARVGRALDPATTVVVNLDALGSGGHLVVSTREGLTAWYAKTDVRWAVETAKAAGIALRPVTFPNVTDAFTARRAGFRTISILSYSDGWITNLHRPSDTLENVRWNTVEDAITLAMRLANQWDEA